MKFRLQIPDNDIDFEELCCRLLRRHWNRPHLQRFAHRGERQDGIDIFDPTNTEPVHAAQCKLHDYGKTIPPKEIDDEVEKAKKYRPALGHYAILTTARKSRQADRKVTAINESHRQHGIFTVEVLTWDEIEDLLDEHPEVRDPIYGAIAYAHVQGIHGRLTAIMQQVATFTEAAVDHIDVELDAIKGDLESHKLELAWELSERLARRQGDRLSERQRWRLATLQGSIRLQQGRFEEAGTLLTKAKQHQPTEEKALLNEAIGYELLNDTNKAHQLAVELRRAFPGNKDAVALWVRTADTKVTSDELEKEAGGFTATSTNVALALAICLLNRSNADGAERYARLATELDAEFPQCWLLLGQSLHVRGFRTDGAKKKIDLLAEAVKAYQVAANLARLHGIKHLEADAVLNRAVARGLLGDPSAGEDFLAAKNLSPREAQVARQYGAYLLLQGNFDRAIEEVRLSLQFQNGGEAKTLLASALWDRNQQGDREEAMQLCRELLDDESPARAVEALEVLVAGLAEAGREGEIAPLIDGFPPDRLSAVARNAIMAMSRLKLGDKSGAEEFARQGLRIIADTTGADDIEKLARSLNRLGLYAASLPLLERIADRSRFDESTRMLLDCANRLGKHQLVIEVCRSLREAGVKDRRLLDNEIDILQLYDRSAAISVLLQHLSSNPEDRLARLRLSGLAIRGERYDLVTADPEQMPPVEEAIPNNVGRLVIGVLAHFGKWLPALRYAYDLLRLNFGDADAHSIYCSVVLSHDRDGQPIETSETVQDGMAVAYQESGEEREHWIIVENDRPQAELNEYPTAHPRAKRMLGLNVGDTFDLSSPGLQTRRARVIKIVSKYVFRFQDSMEQYQARFPDRSDLQRITFASEDGPEGQLDIAPILASLDKRREHVGHVKAIYANRPMPLHCVAEATGRDLFETMSHLTTNSEEGVRWCCIGSLEERQAAIAVTCSCKSFVLDLTAFFAIWRLKLADTLKCWSSRQFIVTQSTFDNLRDLVQKEAKPGTRRHMSAADRGRYIVHEVSDEQRAEYVRSMQDLLDLVRDRCQVVAATETAALDAGLRKQLVELIGRTGLESLIVAARPDHLLWTDDLAAALVGGSELGSDRRSWTQVVLQVAADDGVIKRSEFDQQSARLIGLGYSFTWCNPAIVEQAGIIAKWNCEIWPLPQVLAQFALPTVYPQQKVDLAAGAIVVAFNAMDSPFGREVFVRAILNRLASHRLAQHLAERVPLAFGLDVLGTQQALGIIHDWVSGPLTLP